MSVRVRSFVLLPSFILVTLIASAMLLNAIRKPHQLNLSTAYAKSVLPKFNGAPHYNDAANSILNYRHMIELNKCSDPERTVTVSSYNILSRHYIWENVYNYLPKEYTSWNSRFERLSQNLEDLTHISDILSFQEMEYSIYKSYWKEKLAKLKYESVFQRKPKPAYWSKPSEFMDGVSIFYNTEKFDLIDYKQINLSNYFKTSKVVNQTDDTIQRLNNRNTVALLLILRHKVTGEVLFVSNTHLYWSPKHNDVKLMQTLLLTNLIKNSIKTHYGIKDNGEFDALMNSNSSPVVIMTGDFNSKPASMVYKFLSNGSIDLDHEAEFSQNYGSEFHGVINNKLCNFKSPYKDLYSSGIFQKTTYSQNFKDVIDYIWFSDNKVNNQNKFKFTKVLSDINPEYLKNFEGFPNPDFPSDHIPILAQFEFN